jgi:hypothetical protein
MGVHHSLEAKVKAHLAWADQCELRSQIEHLKGEIHRAWSCYIAVRAKRDPGRQYDYVVILGALLDEYEALVDSEELKTSDQLIADIAAGGRKLPRNYFSQSFSVMHNVVHGFRMTYLARGVSRSDFCIAKLTQSYYKKAAQNVK